MSINSSQEQTPLLGGQKKQNQDKYTFYFTNKINTQLSNQENKHDSTVTQTH